MGYLDASKEDIPLALQISDVIVKTAGVNPRVSPDAEVLLVVESHKGGI